MSPTLGYWDIRGLAEPIRWLLHYKGQDFEDKRYRSYDDWRNDKFKLGLDFPNLPYFIDGDVSLTQSTAILRFLARKHGLDGASEAEKLKLDLLEQQICDFRSSMVQMCLSDEHEKIKEDFIMAVPSQMELFSTFLGDRKWMVGDSITYVDFLAYHTFDFYQLLAPEILKNFPSLTDYMKRFESLPELQKYLSSSTYKRWPIFGPCAHFGGKGEEPKRK